MECLVYLLGLACFCARGRQQEKDLPVKGGDFQISLQIFHTTLRKMFGKLLLKSTPLKDWCFPSLTGAEWPVVGSPLSSSGCYLNYS